MKRFLLVPILVAVAALATHAQVQDANLNQALEKYDRAFRNKDTDAIRSLLAPAVLLYEHSVRNSGLQDVFENHLKPEISEFENLQIEFSDVRITPGTDLALVTRQYNIRGKLGGKDINASGNETMVWSRMGADWKILHIHYSHPCPTPSAPAK